MIKAEIFLDSVGEGGSAPRLTTCLLTMPRFILAEFNTHRMFSRNCPSSRAIPVEKRIKMVLSEPVIPIEWGLNSTQMQAKEIADVATQFKAEQIWRLASLAAVDHAKSLIDIGIHKQIANRLLEPFVTVTVLATSTQVGWENFFALRAEAAADPHMQKLAYDLLEAYNASTPQVLKSGEWHIPFGNKMPEGLTWEEQIKVAVARSARVSFDNFDGTQNTQNDFNLHDRLATQGHWSSFEHIAQVPEKVDPTMGGNLPGWVQLRKTYPHECRKDYRVKEKGAVERAMEPKKKIDLIVDRFLGWKLPADFNPDGGITFTPDFNVGTPYQMRHEPLGTNLLNAIQAKEMLQYILGDLIQD